MICACITTADVPAAEWRVYSRRWLRLKSLRWSCRGTACTRGASRQEAVLVLAKLAVALVRGGAGTQ